MRYLVFCLLLSINVFAQRGIEIIQSIPQVQNLAAPAQASVDPGLFVGYQAVITYAENQSIATPSEPENLINSNLMFRMDSLGFQADYWYKFISNSNAQFARINLATPGVNDATAVEAPTFTLKDGYVTTAGPTASYLNTNYQPSTESNHFTLSSASYGVYVVSNGSGAWAMGSRGGSPNTDMMFRLTGLGRLSSLGGVNFASLTNGVEGLLVFTRTGSTIKAFFNGVEAGTATSSPVALSTFQNFIMTANESGNPGGICAAKFYGAFAGNYIPDASQLKFYQIWKQSVDATKLLSGSGGVDPSPGSSSVASGDYLSPSDIIYNFTTVEVHEEYQGEPSDAMAMLDTAELFFTEGEPTAMKAGGNPVKIWNVPFEEVKQGERKPTYTIYEVKHPTKIVGLWNWQTFKYQGEYAWIQYLGSNDRFTWTPLTDSLRWGYSASFVAKSILDTTNYYRYFKIDRGHVDLNGYNVAGTSGSLKTVFSVRRDTTINYDDRLAEPPPTTNKLKDIFGVNAYYYEPDSLLSYLGVTQVSQFQGETWHFTGWKMPYAIIPSWDFRTGNFTVPENPGGGKFTGSDNLPMQALRGGMDTAFKAWRAAGVNHIVLRVQENHNSYLRDSLNKNYLNGQLMSKDILVMHKYASTPEYFLKYPQVFPQTIFFNNRRLQHYDYGNLLLAKWIDTTYYPLDSFNYSSFVNGSNYISKDSNGVPVKWTSIEDAWRLSPQALAACADPVERERIFGEIDSVADFAHFLYNLAAVYGRNPNISRDSLFVINPETIPLGLDLVDAISGDNEPGKDWKGGMGKHKAKLLGLKRSVNYDGHMGLASHMGSHCLGVHTADSTMQYLFFSDLHDNMSLSIEAQYWCDYFRTRDFDSAPDFHPCSGEAKHIMLENVGWDQHVYRNSEGNAQNQSNSGGNIVTPELHSSQQEVPEFLRVAKAKWPTFKQYKSEAGGSSIQGRFAHNRNDFGGDTAFFPEYDLSFAQASQLIWELGHDHKYYDGVFYFELAEKLIFDKIDTNTTPVTYDREANHNYGGVTGFAGCALYTRGIGRAGKSAFRPKPAAHAFATFMEYAGNCEPPEYSLVGESIDSVAMLKYYDEDDDYYLLVVRRYTARNQRSYEITIPIPAGYTSVTRIEPIRNEYPLEVIDLGTLSNYVAPVVSEKVFFLKCEP